MNRKLLFWGMLFFLLSFAFSSTGDHPNAAESRPTWTGKFSTPWTMPAVWHMEGITDFRFINMGL